MAGTTADKLQAILNSKAAIKTAINNKGGSITDSTPLDEYATAIGNIQTPILQSKTASPSTSQQTITPDGGYNGLSQVTIDAVTSSIDANIQAGNIKKDVVILGVTGTFEGGGGGSSDLDKLIDGSITSVTSSATSVRGYAFMNCTSLTSASFSSATSIGYNAFYGCTSLTSVSSSSATSIGASAFYGCTSLTSASFPNVTTMSGSSTFSNCTNLTTIDLSNLAQMTGTGNFAGCTSLTSLSLPKLTSLSTGSIGAFANCKFQSISMPILQSFSNQNAFQDCTNLTNVYIPLVSSLPFQAFYNCTSLQTFRAEAALLLANWVFKGCTGLEHVILDRCTNIAYNVFVDCTSLQDITLGADSVCAIGNTATLGASALHHLTIYVPANLVSSYQSATNWSTLYNDGYITIAAIPS